MVEQEYVPLGQVDVPDGVLVIIDPGLGRFWRHDSDPTSPRRDAPAEFDLVVEGPDAEAAGRAFDREFDPFHLFDRSNAQKAKADFDDFAKDKGLQATARILESRIPHTDRARFAIAAGSGIGVVKYNGLWAVAVGTPSATAPVQGMPLAGGQFSERWEFIDVIFDESAKVARQEEVQGVMVDYGQLMFSGLGPLGHFNAGKSLDGLADYVFWGRDAQALAREFGASEVDEGLFGWKDIPVESVGERATPIQERLEKGELKIGVDYRPHCNLEIANAMMRKSPEDTSEIALDGSRAVACGNRWGDGIFAVVAMYDSADELVRVRVSLGTEAHQARMRQVIMRSQGAIVTKAILEGEPIRFGERTEPNNPRDSGWFFSAGTESEEYINAPENLAVVNLGTLVKAHPALVSILDSPIGALVKRDGDQFLPDGDEE